MHSFNLNFDKLANQILNENISDEELMKNLSPEKREMIDTLLDEHGDGEIGLQDALRAFLGTSKQTPEKLAKLKRILSIFVGSGVEINLENESVYVVDSPSEEAEEETESEEEAEEETESEEEGTEEGEEESETEGHDPIKVVSEEEPEEGGLEVVLDVKGEKITAVLHPSGEIDYFDAEGNVWGAEGEEYFSDVQDFILTKYPMDEDEE